MDADAIEAWLDRLTEEEAKTIYDLMFDAVHDCVARLVHCTAMLASREVPKEMIYRILHFQFEQIHAAFCQQTASTERRVQ